MSFLLYWNAKIVFHCNCYFSNKWTNCTISFTLFWFLNIFDISSDSFILLEQDNLFSNVSSPMWNYPCVSSAYIWWLTSWVLIIWLIDVVYKQNRKGPRTDPCGMPKWRSCGHESEPSMCTCCCLFEMYDLNHWKTVPEMPKCTCSRSKRVEWSMVSKAADRSNSVRAVTLPLSMLHIMSLWILKRVVSGEWLFLAWLPTRLITKRHLVCMMLSDDQTEPQSLFVDVGFSTSQLASNDSFTSLLTLISNQLWCLCSMITGPSQPGIANWLRQVRCSQSS